MRLSCLAGNLELKAGGVQNLVVELFVAFPDLIERQQGKLFWTLAPCNFYEC